MNPNIIIDKNTFKLRFEYYKKEWTDYLIEIGGYFSEGTWTIPGGKLDFKEIPEQGAAREALEETGIKTKNLKLISVGNEIVHDAHFITLGFLAEEFEGEPFVMEPDEITKWEWFDLNNLPKPMFFPAEKVIKNYLAKEIYKH